jgi:hypothetical protein
MEKMLAGLRAGGVELATSAFVSLEVLPRPVSRRRDREAAAMLVFFSRVDVMVDHTSAIWLAHLVLHEGGISSMDALHVGAAASAGAMLVTMEKPTSGIFRGAKWVKVHSLEGDEW